METILQVLVTAASFYIGAHLLKGVEIRSFVYAIFIALVIAALNYTLGTVLRIVSLGLLSLGVFTLFLDAILIQVADYFLKEFKVKNFWWALGLALIVSIANGILSRIIF